MRRRQVQVRDETLKDRQPELPPRSESTLKGVTKVHISYTRHVIGRPRTRGTEGMPEIYFYIQISLTVSTMSTPTNLYLESLYEYTAPA